MREKHDQPMTIVKVQIPIFSTEDNPGCLVYAKGGKRTAQQTITEETANALGNDLKGYFDAEWDVGGHWVIGKRVADQNW